MTDSINFINLCIYLSNVSYFYFLIFYIILNNDLFSISNYENDYIKLIDEMEDIADYENDEKWQDYFCFIENKINESDRNDNNPLN